MKIIISVPRTDGKFRYRIEIPDLCLWHSQSFYHKRQDALNAALLDTWSVLIEQIFFTPAGLFDLKTGIVLLANYAHRIWLGRDCVGSHYSQILSNFKADSRIVPAGTRALGLYEVSRTNTMRSAYLTTE
jgi:hypothetical protein